MNVHEHARPPVPHTPLRLPQSPPRFNCPIFGIAAYRHHQDAQRPSQQEISSITCTSIRDYGNDCASRPPLCSTLRQAVVRSLCNSSCILMHGLLQDTPAQDPLFGVTRPHTIPESSGQHIPWDRKVCLLLVRHLFANPRRGLAEGIAGEGGNTVGGESRDMPTS